jgi:aspartate ammonia-lyase
VNRIEEDFVGKVELSENILYGINTVRSIQNLSFSNRLLHQYPDYLKALAYVKKAATMANQHDGMLTEEMCQAISEACEEVVSGTHNEQFVIDMLHGGGGIAANMNVNEVIANLANEKLGGTRGRYEYIHPTDHVNASQSTSDVCHTAMRMAIISNYESLNTTMSDLIHTIDEKASELNDVTTIARTCLQDGMRTKLGDTFNGYTAMLKRRHVSLGKAVQELHHVNLGGTVIGCGTGASEAYRGIVLDLLKDVSGLSLRHRENLFDAAQNMDDIAKVSSELHLLASCLIKLAKDLRLLSSGPEAGFSEIRLPSVQAGSSFFPGKVNPVIPETLIQCGFQVIACDRAVQGALEHGELNLNVFEGAAGANVLDAMNMLKKAVSTFVKQCIIGIQANETRCGELASSTIPLVVELKETYGYSFVSNLVKEKGLAGVKDYYLHGGDE